MMRDKREVVERQLEFLVIVYGLRQMNVVKWKLEYRYEYVDSVVLRLKILKQNKKIMCARYPGLKVS